MGLREDQIHRYARHVLLREVGGGGQARLLAGSVSVPGNLRAAEEAAIYLAAAGVGRLVLAPDLAQRVGPRIAAMNQDVEVTDEGPVDLEITPMAPEDSRAAGALAAMAALTALSGATDGGPTFVYRDLEASCQPAR